MCKKHCERVLIQKRITFFYFEARQLTAILIYLFNLYRNVVGLYLAEYLLFRLNVKKLNEK